MSNRKRNADYMHTKLNQAMNLLSRLIIEPDDMLDITDTPIHGITVLKKLGLIEIFDHNTLTYLGDDGEQHPRIMAIIKE